MIDYVEKCPKPIPIGKQEFAYQCEGVVLEPIHGSISIRGYVPYKGGSKPYPNPEKDTIEHYTLEIGRHTQNAIEVRFIKKFKDGSEDLFLTTLSYSDLVNLIFGDQPANIIHHNAPVIPSVFK